MTQDPLIVERRQQARVRRERRSLEMTGARKREDAHDAE